MSSRYLSAYRSIMREIRQLDNRNSAAERSIRFIFESSIASATVATKTALHRDVENAVLFLKSQKKYKALLERYNPLHGMSQEERVHATARRVGLDVPLDVKIKS